MEEEKKEVSVVADPKALLPGQKFKAVKQKQFKSSTPNRIATPLKSKSKVKTLKKSGFTPAIVTNTPSEHSMIPTSSFNHTLTGTFKERKSSNHLMERTSYSVLEQMADKHVTVNPVKNGKQPARDGLKYDRSLMRILNLTEVEYANLVGDLSRK